MNSLCFDVFKRWTVDEWYGEYLHIFEQGKGTTPILVLNKGQVEELIKVWNEQRIEKKRRQQT